MTHDVYAKDALGRQTLAIYGGTPVRRKPFPKRKAFGEEERKAVLAAIDYYESLAQDLPYQGHFEESYARAFADSLGGGHADAVATGSAALYVAIAALALPEGAEVLTAPISDPGTYSAIILNRLKPRLVDSEPGNFNISLRQLTTRLTPAVKAVLAVHAAGQPIQDISNIANYCKTNGLRLVEDCSQAHGARTAEGIVGSFGDIAAFSTMYRKAHITGSSGGVVFSKNLALLRQAMAFADRGKPFWQEGFNEKNPATFLFPALNLHSNELSCAIGLSSLNRLEKTLAARRSYALKLAHGIASTTAHCRLANITPYDSPFILPVHVDSMGKPFTARDFGNALLGEGIELNPHYAYLATSWPWITPYLADGFATPNAAQTIANCFCLYINENYGQEEIDDTLSAILKVEAAFAGP